MINPIKGLVHVTGEPDTGKTTFAYTAADPARTVFLDDDLKGESVHQAVHFAVYHNLVREFAQSGKRKPIEFHDLVVGLLQGLPQGRYDSLVFDNWSRMEDGIRDYSEAHMSEFSSLTPGQQQKFSQMTWAYTYIYYAQVLDMMLRVAPLVILTTHVRDQYLGNTKTGKLEPRGQRPLIEKASLRIWTRHNPDGPEPIGLVLKRISKPTVENGRVQVVNVLPRKLNPCVWWVIQDYWDMPIGNRMPSAHERPDEYELSILDGTLTQDQKHALRLAVMEADREGASPLVPQDGGKPDNSKPDNSPAARARALLAEHPDMELMDLASALGVTAPEAKRLKEAAANAHA